MKTARAYALWFWTCDRCFEKTNDARLYTGDDGYPDRKDAIAAARDHNEKVHQRPFRKDVTK